MDINTLIAADVIRVILLYDEVYRLQFIIIIPRSGEYYVFVR